MASNNFQKNFKINSSHATTAQTNGHSNPQIKIIFFYCSMKCIKEIMPILIELHGTCEHILSLKWMNCCHSVTAERLSIT